MRFMVMHKMTEALENQVVDQEVLAGVDELIGEAAGQNVFISGEGLKPTAMRTHVVYKNGRRTTARGPFADAKELVGGFALMRVRDEAEALHWCDRFAAVAGDVELYLGPVVEMWDLGMAPRPPHPPLRVLSLMRATRDDDAPPDAAEAAKVGAMNALIAEMTAAGVLEATGGLASTKRGARIRFDGGKPRVIDGPFAESKELIAGYAILELPSKAAAIEWGARFGAIVKVDEVDVREMA
jgi:hypothetical protein